MSVPSPLRIRPMVEADLPQVMQIERVSYSTPWPESSFHGLLDRIDTLLLTAEVEGVVVGYAVCWTVLEQGELGNIAVSPARRRQQIGRRLLEASVHQMRDRGIRELYLEVRISNTGAQELYRQFGFLQVGRRRDYYSLPTEDALVLCLHLVG